MSDRARSLFTLFLTLAMASTCALATAAPGPPLIDFDHPGFWPLGAPVAITGPEVVCEIGVSLDQPTAIGGFEARVSLRSEPGWPSPDPVQIAPFCRAAPGVELEIGAVQDGSEELGLTAAGVADGAGFAGPGRLFSCSLDLGAVVLVPTIADFETVVVEAYDPHSAPIEPLPSISVSAIECQVIGTTTLQPGSTTTTFPELTTTTLVSPQEACFVTFGLGAISPLGGVDFSVDYAGAEVDLAGEGPDVECADLVAADAFTAADDDTGRVVGLEISRSASFGGPAELAVCSFLAAFPALPTPADFIVFDVTAVDGLGTRVEPAPRVMVSGVNCLTPASSSTSTSTSSSLGLASGSSSTSSSSSSTFPPPSTTASTLAALPACVDPAGDGVSATDALVVLQAAVAVRTCQTCVCDADGNGRIAATDALIALRTAVGTAAALACPACGG
ncbi:MAG: hypothetical protein V3R77_00765 [Candidatus Binatia bacterium]